MVQILPAHHQLFYGVDDRLERLWIIHGKVRKNLTVQADILLGELAHELGIGHAVLAGGGVDTLDPESPEFALLGLAVTVGIGQTFLIGVLRYRPNVLPGKEITAGPFENLLAACP